MPAYSFGQRWVGIVSGAEAPAPLALAALRQEAASDAVWISRDLWMEIAYLRRTWTKQAGKLSRRATDGSRFELNRAADEARLRVLERALALLDAGHPHLPADIVAQLLPWAKSLSGSSQFSPDSVGPDVVLVLGPGRRFGPDDVRQMLRQLGRAYHFAGQHAQADRCRLLVSDLQKGRSVTLDAETLNALERASR